MTITGSMRVIALVALVLLSVPVLLVAAHDRAAGTLDAGVSPLRPKRDFHYIFNTTETLQEADSPADSRSPYWWLDSGGQMIFAQGVGGTNRGALSETSPWRLTYAVSNPVDTDNGYHPQNIFRLLTKDRWRNFRQEVYAFIAGENASASPNRNESNGIFLFNRYQDQNNLYYAGVRVDGAVVIKKKLAGRYYQLAYAPYFQSSLAQTGPHNLLPLGTWLGLRTEVTTLPDHAVRIVLSLDPAGTGHWQPVLSAVDDGRQFGPAIVRKGSGGLRTDFMDVVFRDFRMHEL